MAKEQTTFSVDNASVQERQVTVRVLTIGTKQVTQTMYKQLPEEQVIDIETGELLGEVWGWVNLHDNDCPKGPHLHAIWESNGQLKRAYSHKSSGYRGHREFLTDQLRDLSIVYICFVALADRGFTNWKEVDSQGVLHTYLSLTVKNLHIRAEVPPSIRAIWRAPNAIKKYQQEIAELRAKSDDSFPSIWPRDEQIKSKQEQIDRAMKEVDSIREGGIEKCLKEKWAQYEDLNPEQYTSYEQVYKDMESRADEIITRDQRWAESYKTIENAGQLFIAVSGVWK